MKDNLPPDWKWVKLSDIVEVNPKIPSKEKIYNKMEVQFLPMKLVDEVVGKVHLTEVRKYDEVQKSYTSFVNGDVIFAKVTPCMENGKVAVVDNLKNGIGFGSSEFHVLRPKGAINNKYLFNYIVQNRFRNEAKNEMTGAVGLRRVPKQFIENYQFPLPPISEQHAIVSKIEELFSELDKGKQQLETALQQLKVYRQAVLKWAFEGKLSELGSVGLKDDRISVDNDKNEILQSSNQKNPNSDNLPKGWKWVKLGEILEFVGSGVTPKGGQSVYQDSGVIFLRSQNVYPNKLELEDVAFISDTIDEKMKRTRVLPLDVLLNITGASIGRCAFVPEKFPRANVNQHVCILRVGKGKLVSSFLTSYLNSPKAQSEIMNTQSGATRQGLNFQQIRNIEIPLCTLSEQEDVIQQIESRLSVCDKLEETINQNLAQAETLRQSILKKAFEGKLLPQKNGKQN